VAAVNRTIPLSARRILVPPGQIAVLPARGTLAVGALIGANVVWGGSVAATAALLDHIPPLTLACCRAGIGLALLLMVLALTGGRPATGRRPALLGLTGVTLFCAGQNLGLRYASATTTSLINGAIPALTALLAIAFLHERTGRRRLVGLVASLLGVAMLVWRGSGAPGGAVTRGDFLPLLSAASFALFAVLGRRVFDGENALAVVAGSTGYGLLFLLPGAFVEVTSGGRNVITVTPHDLLLLIFLGAGCSALAFVLAAYGLAHLEAGHSAAFGNLKPLVGIALAVTLLGETVTGGQMLGGALVLLGVIVAGRSMPGMTSRSDAGGGDGRTAL
jgi:drug/metabolite transporter (DMT)-like permease